jgi:hypothetical protein
MRTWMLWYICHMSLAECPFESHLYRKNYQYRLLSILNMLSQILFSKISKGELIILLSK